MAQIKICGMMRPCDIDYINEAKPDYVGFILAPGRRRTISEETVAADIAAGAPANADGTVDIFLYAAWVLSKENSRHAS